MLPSRRCLFHGRPCSFQDDAKAHSARIHGSVVTVQVLNGPATSHLLKMFGASWNVKFDKGHPELLSSEILHQVMGRHLETANSLLHGFLRVVCVMFSGSSSSPMRSLLWWARLHSQGPWWQRGRWRRSSWPCHQPDPDRDGWNVQQEERLHHRSHKQTRHHRPCHPETWPSGSAHLHPPARREEQDEHPESQPPQEPHQQGECHYSGSMLTSHLLS